MQKVSNMTKEELAHYGTLIGEAFAAEGDGIATTAPREDIIKAFEIMTEYFYNSGVLYTTSDNHEGFLAYWRKSTKIKLKPALHMVGRMEKDYVAVSMVVVMREYQGKGYMKRILEHPFSEAAREGIPCVLDTDTELKVAKYTKCGMKNTAKKQLKSGQYLYTMEYRED